MTKYQFTITIGASPIQLSAAAIVANQILAGAIASGVYSKNYLPSAKLFLQSKNGNTGIIYIGDPGVSSSNFSYEIGPPASAGQPGGAINVESHTDISNVDLSQFWVAGTLNDVLIVSYMQS